MLRRCLLACLLALTATACPSKSGVPSGPATVSDNPEPPPTQTAPDEPVPHDEPPPRQETPAPVASPAPEAAVPPPNHAPTTPVPAGSLAPSSAPPSPPTGPCDPAVDCCRKDADCVTIDAPQPCACPPCGKVWRWTLNERGHADYQDRWSRRRCRMPECQSCSGEYVGQAACLEGRCVVR